MADKIALSGFGNNNHKYKDNKDNLKDNSNNSNSNDSNNSIMRTDEVFRGFLAELEAARQERQSQMATAREERQSETATARQERQIETAAARQERYADMITRRTEAFASQAQANASNNQAIVNSHLLAATYEARNREA